MSFFDALRFRLDALVHPGRHERESAEEVEFHLDLDAMQVAGEGQGGVSGAEARYAARPASRPWPR